MWELVAAGVAAGAALVEFVGWRANRRAAELAQLDQAIGAAATRADPVEHAYRAHLLQRMQKIHGSRVDAGLWAVAWAACGAFFFVMAIASTEETMVAKAILMSGLLGSLFLAGRYWTRRLDAQRTDHDATGEAFEAAMVAARRSFIEASKGLPALRSVPDLQRQAIHDFKRAAVRERRNIAYYAGVLAFIGAFVVVTGHAMRQDWVEFATLVWVTSWIVGVGYALPPPRLGRWIRRATSTLPRAYPPTTVVAHLLWPAASILLLPRLVQKLMAWLLRTDPSPMPEGPLAVLGAFLLSGWAFCVIAWGWAKRFWGAPPRTSTNSTRS